MDQNTTYSVVDHIISVRAIIKRREGVACTCSYQVGDIYCAECRLTIHYNDLLRELEREPEGVELLARELAEFKARPKVVDPIYAGMNDIIPF
jgi:hypothetical protein